MNLLKRDSIVLRRKKNALFDSNAPRQIIGRILRYVEIELDIVQMCIDHPYLAKSDKIASSSKSNLSWTSRGAKAAIIELITALNATGEIETVDGRPIEIKDFVEAFEAMFNISLPNYYQHKSNLINRKLCTTPFLDRLVNAFTSYCTDK